MTSCMPLPQAAAMPMFPRRTLLHRPMAMPLIKLRPQSGPIIRRPLSRARVFKRTSCSMGTLSLNMNTSMPIPSAFSASAAAYCPATEMTARFLSFTERPIVSRVRYFLPPFEARCSVSIFMNLSRASSAAFSSSAAIAITRSLGDAARPSSVSRPSSRIVSLLRGVPMPTLILPTRASLASAAARRIRNTLS